MNESKSAQYKEFIDLEVPKSTSVDNFVEKHTNVWDDDSNADVQIESPVKSVYEMNVDEIEQILDPK